MTKRPHGCTKTVPAYQSWSGKRAAMLTPREKFIADWVTAHPKGVTSWDSDLQHEFHARFGGSSFTCGERVARILTLLCQSRRIDGKIILRRSTYFPPPELIAKEPPHAPQ